MASACTVQPVAPRNPLSVPEQWKPVLEQHFQEIEKCSGLTGDFSELRIYLVPQGSLSYLRSDAGGVMIPPRSIYIEDDDWSIRLLDHEYMHYLIEKKILGLRLKDSHPMYYFNGVCGNLMSGA